MKFFPCKLFFVSAVALAQPLYAGTAHADIAACKAAPDVECLASIGYVLAMQAESYPQRMTEVELLAQIGWLDEAYKLAVHYQLQNGASQQSADTHARILTGSYRVIFDSTQDGDPWEDFSGHPISVFIQALGHSHVDSALELRTTTDPVRLDFVRDWANVKLSSTRLDQLIAADLLLAVGEDRAALRILDTLKDDDSRPSDLSLDMIRLIGPDRALEVYESMGEFRPRYYANLARALSDKADAQKYLSLMLAAAKARDEGVRLHSSMRNIVEVATELGLQDFAQEVYVEFEEMLQLELSTQSLWFLVRAQEAIGVSEADIRHTLNRAARGLDDLSGFSKTSFAKSLAWHYARLGDTTSAIRMLSFGEDASIHDWSYAAGKDVPVETRNDMLLYAKKTFSPSEHAAIRARVAAILASPKRSSKEQDIARDMAWQLLREPAPFLEAPGGYMYDNILKAGERLGEEALIEAALSQSAQRALESDAYRPILQAAHQHFHMDQR